MSRKVLGVNIRISRHSLARLSQSVVLQPYKASVVTARDCYKVSHGATCNLGWANVGEGFNKVNWSSPTHNHTRASASRCAFSASFF